MPYFKAELGDLSTYQPSPDQLVRWLEATADLPWDPIASLSEFVDQPVVCPVCGCSVGARKSLVFLQVEH